MAGVHDQFTPAEIQDCEFLRTFLVACLAPPEIRYPQTLIDQDRSERSRAKPIKRDNPRRFYRFPGDENLYLAPPGANRTHATATRVSGSSRVLVHDRMSPRYVQAIWRLPSRQICALQARYAHSPALRVKSQQHLAARCAKVFTEPHVKHRAKVAAIVLLQGGDTDQVREALGMEKTAWRDSQGRRTVYSVRDWLECRDVEALLAWRGAWGRVDR